MPVKPTTRVNQGSSARVKFQLVDFDGTGVASTLINTATMDLKDQRTGKTINSRTAVDVSASFDPLGNFSFVLSASDNTIVSTGNRIKVETHIMTIKVNANAGGGTIDLNEEIWIEVVNLETV